MSHSCGNTGIDSLFSTKKDSHYKDKLFPYGECLHVNIKDADQCITCLPILKYMININCASDFCGECPEYNIPDEELSGVPN